MQAKGGRTFTCTSLTVGCYGHSFAAFVHIESHDLVNPDVTALGLPSQLAPLRLGWCFLLPPNVKTPL